MAFCIRWPENMQFKGCIIDRYIIIRGIEDYSNMFFSYFSMKTYVVTAHQNHLSEMVLMSSNKICFYGEIQTITLKCLNIGTSKTINFPFVPNGKLMIFRCPNI